MNTSTLQAAFHPTIRREWSELDEMAAREGAAALRLYRRTGADDRRLPDGRSYPAAVAAASIRVDRRHDYDTRAAVAAFEKLFSGGGSKRVEAPGSSSARVRRFRARRRQALQSA